LVHNIIILFCITPLRTQAHYNLCLIRQHNFDLTIIFTISHTKDFHEYYDGI